MPRALIVRSKSNDPWYNLALEEFLMQKLSRAAAGESDLSAILYLWQNQNTVVIGRNQNAWAECRTGLLEEEGGRLARRSTGGGAVFHDLGNLNFSLLLPESDFDLDRNFQMIVDTVRREGIEAVRSGRNDILADGLKFSGNAFRINNGVGLHHGTLLVHSAFERVARYLTVNPSKLAAKGVTSVRSRITNLQVLRPGITVEHLSDAMENSFISTFCSSPADIPEKADPEKKGQGFLIERKTDSDYEHDPLLISLREQFASWEWRFGESIKFDSQIEHKFDWGHIQIGLNVHQGVISSAQIYSDALDCDFIDPVINCLKGLHFHSAELAEAVLKYAPEGDGFGISRKKMAEDIADLLRVQGW